MFSASRFRLARLACAAIVAGLAIAPRAASADVVGGTAGDGAGHNMAYRLYRPTVAPTPGQKFPLVVFLHGVGERGINASDTSSTLITSHVTGLINTTQGAARPAYLLMPQVPNAGTAGYNTTDSQPQFVNVPFGTGAYNNALPAPAQSIWMGITLSLLDSTINANNIDTTRIYVTGLSMGGYGTWDIMGRRPGMFAASVPMSGGGNTDTAGLIKNIPTWAFHGSADGTVPVAGSRNMINAMTAAGGSPRYGENGGGHVIWAPLYNDESTSLTGGGLYSWMFSQSVPEPGTFGMIGIAGGALLLRKRRAQHAA